VWGAYGLVALALATEVMMLRARVRVRAKWRAALRTGRRRRRNETQTSPCGADRRRRRGALESLRAGAVGLPAEPGVFYTPSDVAANKAPANQTFRVGGLVETGSVKREGVRVTFRVTDTAQTITVAYDGILPDLFREGKRRGRGGPDRTGRGVPGLPGAGQAQRELHAPEAGRALEQAEKARRTLKVPSGSSS